MLNQRASGILLHPTSLPGPYGSGDFGEHAYRYIDWLKQAGQRYWQMLPLSEIGPGNSPYMSCSAFAGSVLLIDLHELAEQGWLTQSDLIPHPDFNTGHVEFGLVVPYRLERLRCAAKVFFADVNNAPHRAEYEAYCVEQKAWLDDYALFKTIEHLKNGCAWGLWPNGLAQRDAGAIQQVIDGHQDLIGFWKFCQWNYARQWTSLKKYAAANGVQIIGDVPIFVAYQSSDVWAHQELFELGQSGLPTVVAGVPPDYFSETGQLWGNPLYRWDAHERTGYAWWVARLAHALEAFDIVRIDHFRGFAEYWEVPANAPTAVHGRWMPGPGAKLFQAIQQAFGTQLPIIAEDLGLITPDVIALRNQFALPGMRIMQFAFGDGMGNHFLPHHYVENTVAYTGTHDNDTTLGWWETLPEHSKIFAQEYLASNGHLIHQDMIRALSRSIANTVIFPMQDVLGLNGEHRMNFPGQATGNWEWRFTWSQILTEHTKLMASLAEESGRKPVN